MKHSILLKMAIVFALMIGGIFSSCKKDDPAVEPEEQPVEKLPTVEVTNAQLKAALVKKGFPFDEQGLLIKSDSVLNITTLDISDCELDDAAGLEIFSKLEDLNLADNKFFYKFDFAVLPASVVKIDLSGNEIYEFPGLINVVVEENGDETVTLLRQLKKLHLPQSAKYNCYEVVYIYEQLKTKINAGEVDFKIENADGQLSAYNTLREVPDNITRAILQTLYPSFFEGEYIDIAKRVFDLTEVTKAMSMGTGLNTSVDGVQYILHHRDFRGATVIIMVNTGDIHTVIPYLKIPSHITTLTMDYVDTPNGIDFSEAENLFRLTISNNTGLKTLDLSASKTFGQRTVLIEFVGTSTTYLFLAACTNLKEIIYPEATHWIYSIYLFDLPAMETVDLSKFETIYFLKLGFLPGRIVYFEPKQWVNGANLDAETGKLYLGLRRDVAYKDETINFIRTYRDHLSGNNGNPSSGRVDTGEDPNYRWDRDNELKELLNN
jgi:hypothetical protein